VQDAAVRAWRSLSTFDAERSFRSWYLRIVANAARNAIRSEGRRAALSVRGAHQVAPGASQDPADHAVTEEERRLVVAALNRLGRDDRLVVALRHFEQLTEREMAEVLGCAPGTVKSRLSRAMQRLHDELASDGGGR
jgi:RNA polymerase sigma factor (sigma-70 family)